MTNSRAKGARTERDLRAELAEKDRQLAAARTVAAHNVEAAFHIEERHE